MRDGFDFSAATRRYLPPSAAVAYRPAGFLGAASENRHLAFFALMSDIACQYRILTGLFDAMIVQESGYKPAIYSTKSAFGLAQLMPATTDELGVDRYDTAQNLRGGAKYLQQQLDRIGQVHLALVAYSAGPGRVRNGVLPPIAETRASVKNILPNWQRIAGETTQTIARSGRHSSMTLRPLVRSASVST